jgi:hypothetical protein
MAWPHQPKAMKHLPSLTATILFILLSASLSHSQGNWAWMMGPMSQPFQGAVFGPVGVPSSTATPGSRYGSVTWTDNNGMLWLFGGYEATLGIMNDLWKYNPATNQWTWMKGSSSPSQTGDYGTMGVSSASNNPGGRNFACGWKDANGDLWLFGGDGYDMSVGAYLSDLWKYSVTTNEWTWMHGPSIGNQNGSYGTANVASSSNLPGSRYAMCTWTDNNGNLWMFGGWGNDGWSGNGYLNDLWMFSVSLNQWVWVKGATIADDVSVYGTLGVPATSNTPGSRGYISSWVSSNGDLWLFGGVHFGVYEFYNDLWRFNITSGSWTWMGGTNGVNMNGAYGTLNVPSTSNVPGSRAAACAWRDTNGDFWLFGGYGFDGTSSMEDNLNDLWKYDMSSGSWTWIKGSAFNSAVGNYGTMGVPSPTNTPGARAVALKWTGTNGDFWLFGGSGQSTSSSGVLSDLWRFTLCNLPPAPVNATSPGNLVICSGKSTVLSVSNGTVPVYWYSSATSTSSLATGNSYITPPLYTSNVPTVITFYAEGRTCDGGPRTPISVTVNAAPGISAAGGTICAGNMFVIQPSGAVSYSYSSGSPTVSPAVTSTFGIAGASPEGCVGILTITIGVVPLPAVTASATAAMVCPGESTTLTADGAASYIWFNGSNGSVTVVSPAVTTTYSVSGSVPPGCTVQAVVTVSVGCEGINEEASLTLRVFPNPANGRLSLEGNESELSVELFSVNGARVKTARFPAGGGPLDIQDVPPGIYLLRSTWGERIRTVRIIKQ